MPRTLVLAVLVLLTALAGALGGCRAVQDRPGGVTDQPFTLSEAGGIDGRMDTLLVRADGTAVLMSRRPVAGRIGPGTLDRVRRLLATEDLREEAAAARRTQVPVCADAVSTTLTAGDLTITGTAACQGVSQPPFPVFAEIVRLLAPALGGRFDGPVVGDQPPLVPLRLEGRPLGQQQDSVVTVDTEGRVRRTTAGRADGERRLGTGERDVLRLLLDRLPAGPVEPCRGPGRYVVTVRGPVEISGPDCGFAGRQAEVRAVVSLVENQFR